MTRNTQSSLAQYNTSTNGDSNNGELGDILSKDDTIDALTDNEVIDVWVRTQLARKIMRSNSPGYMHSREWEWVQDSLKNADNSVLREIAITVAGRDSHLADGLGWENGPGNPRTLCKKFCGRWPDSDDIGDMRDVIKQTVKQCGTPDIDICQHRIEQHTE